MVRKNIFYTLVLLLFCSIELFSQVENYELYNAAEMEADSIRVQTYLHDYGTKPLKGISLKALKNWIKSDSVNLSGVDTFVYDFKIVNDTVFEIYRNDGLILQQILSISKFFKNGARLHEGGSAADTANIIGNIYCHDWFYWSVDTCKMHVLFRQCYGGNEFWKDFGEFAIRGDCSPTRINYITGDGISPILVPNVGDSPGNHTFRTLKAETCLIADTTLTGAIRFRVDTTCIKDLQEEYTFLNIGSGAFIIKDTTNKTIQIRSLKGGGCIKVTTSGDEIIVQDTCIHIDNDTSSTNELQVLNTVGTTGGSGVGSFATTLSQSGGSIKLDAGDNVELEKILDGLNGHYRIKVLSQSQADSFQVTQANSNAFTVSDGITQSASFTLNTIDGLIFSNYSGGYNGQTTIGIDPCSAWWAGLPLFPSGTTGEFLFINSLGCLGRKACTCSTASLHGSPSMLVSGNSDGHILDEYKKVMYQMALKMVELEKEIKDLKAKSK